MATEQEKTDNELRWRKKCEAFYAGILTHPWIRPTPEEMLLRHALVAKLQILDGLYHYQPASREKILFAQREYDQSALALRDYMS